MSGNLLHRLSETADSELPPLLIEWNGHAQNLARLFEIPTMPTQDDRASESAALKRLSRRERQVLKLAVEGKSDSEIAALLQVALKSVESYRGRMMDKLGIQDLPSLVKFAIRNGITPL